MTGNDEICLQDFTLDFYLRQTWNDPRLAFRHHPYNIFDDDIESLTVSSLSLIRRAFTFPKN